MKQQAKNISTFGKALMCATNYLLVTTQILDRRLLRGIH
jgi:hypothetical protein